MEVYTFLIISPVFFSLIVLINRNFFRNAMSIFFVICLSFLSLLHLSSFEINFQMLLPHEFHTFFFIVDILLLSYFLFQGIWKRSAMVVLLSSLQIILYGVVLSLNPKINSNDILIDEISSIMYLIINSIGGLIIVYALKYIESEEFSNLKKRAFIAILFFFLGVMNFIVSTNNIEMFFTLFELTTLSSFILIAYRGDEISSLNAIKALWMNQIGGVAILLALIFSITHYDTINFDILVANIDADYLLPIVLLALAGFVKGASIPFDKWLLGAMVAPTPVSAILHSATMVKIAPFLMLKLAPAMSGFVSLTITLIGTFVFFSASLLALGKDYFKEILGLSTIALLALMMALAAIGTQQAITACLIFMVFHAISKALLFLQAGILEKSFHLKYINDIEGLINHSPLVTLFIIIGFASLTLPPFGAFIAKFMAIESIADMISTNPLYVIVLIFIALGSVFLTLLYFKVLTKLFTKDCDVKMKKVEISKYYTLPSYILVILLVLGIYISLEMNLLNSLEILTPLFLIFTVAILFVTLLFKKAHRVREYHCGEKDELKLSMYYFTMPKNIQQILTIITSILIFILIIGVAL